MIGSGDSGLRPSTKPVRGPILTLYAVVLVTFTARSTRLSGMLAAFAAMAAFALAAITTSPPAKPMP